MTKNLTSLVDLAASGDAAAQYRLAAALSDAGNPDEARRWNEKAAAAGHPGALYTKATAILSLPPASVDQEAAVEILTRAADAGGPSACRLLGVLSALGFGGARNWRKALTLVAQAAVGGHPGACRELAALALAFSDDASIKGQACALLRRAATQNDWIAAYLGVRQGTVFSQDEHEVLVRKLRAGNAPLAQSLGISRVQPITGHSSQSADINEIAEAIPDPRLIVQGFQSKQMWNTPAIIAAPGVIPPVLNDYLICAAAPSLRQAAVVDHEKSANAHASFRTSDDSVFQIIDLDLALIAVYELIAQIAGLPISQAELMGVLRYRPGQEYKPHHDYLLEDDADYSQIRRSGQRVATALAWLNDGFDGGATQFPKLGIEHKGMPGEVLFFRNTDQEETPLPDSLHAGAPVTKGEKWLLTVWFRARRFWYWD